MMKGSSEHSTNSHEVMIKDSNQPSTRCKGLPMGNGPLSTVGRCKGFTLLEVLVSMFLISMITLTMAFALRITIQAWQRGENEGEKLQVEVALPYLLERQLRSVVDKSSLTDKGNAREMKLEFFKKDNIFSFYTSYSPQGTPAQGLIRVAYVYDEEAKNIKVYERVIGSKEDIDDSNVMFSGSDEIYPVSTITDVETFSLTFPPADEPGKGRIKRPSDPVDVKLDINAFTDTWDDPLRPVPEFVRMVLAQAGRRSGREAAWLLKVGGNIH